LFVRILSLLALLFCATSSFAQDPRSTAPVDYAPIAALAEIQQSSSSPQSTNSSQLPSAPQPANAPNAVAIPPSKQQTKRILGVMPNFRAVSQGTIPPPPGPNRAFVIATENSFDYSAFVFVGVTSLLAEGSNAHPTLGKGIGGYWGYYWRGYLDKTDGNYLVIWALPSVLHEDERYFTRGQGSILGRGVYAASRVLITPDYHGHDTANIAELGGRAIAQAVSLSYYPSADRSFGDVAERYGYAIGRDALTATFREFWPDIEAHVMPHHKRGN
jgi:hypothetical protein